MANRERPDHEIPRMPGAPPAQWQPQEGRRKSWLDTTFREIPWWGWVAAALALGILSKIL